MAQHEFKYVIIGGGLAGTSAIKGIRQLDKNGSILMLAGERHRPYDRPPLTKQLWFGKKEVREIFLGSPDYFNEQGVDLKLGVLAASLNPERKTVIDNNGQSYAYEKLLLATGAVPRMLDVPGGAATSLNAGVCYYRYLDDYEHVRSTVLPGVTVVVIGGGFIGSEIAAALCANKANVTMVFPENYLCSRIFPHELGKAMQKRYIKSGINILNEDVPVMFEEENDRYITYTRSGKKLESSLVIVGVGTIPSVELAQAAGLQVGNGIIVDKYLCTSNGDIFAAGDNAYFPHHVFGEQMRIEHWDNARKQGKLAGRNMAGAGELYDHMPYFFSDLFEFGYEAVGMIDSRLEIQCDWEKPNEIGFVYYTVDNIIRGVMMCNVWGKVDWARDLIRRGERLAVPELRKAV
ncbi:MAG: FAD/NAD(P)-binding oxidoreductase [Bdellovibrionota bacterium]